MCFFLCKISTIASNPFTFHYSKLLLKKIVVEAYVPDREEMNYPHRLNGIPERGKPKALEKHLSGYSFGHIDVGANLMIINRTYFHGTMPWI